MSSCFCLQICWKIVCDRQTEGYVVCLMTWYHVGDGANTISVQKRLENYRKMDNPCRLVFVYRFAGRLFLIGKQKDMLVV